MSTRHSYCSHQSAVRRCFRSSATWSHHEITKHHCSSKGSIAELARSAQYFIKPSFHLTRTTNPDFRMRGSTHADFRSQPGNNSSNGADQFGVWCGNINWGHHARFVIFAQFSEPPSLAIMETVCEISPHKAPRRESGAVGCAGKSLGQLVLAATFDSSAEFQPPGAANERVTRAPLPRSSYIW